MKKGVVFLLILVFLLSGCVQSAVQKPASGNTVSISGFKFVPSVLSIKAGEAVSWVNEDSAPHTVKFSFYESEKISTGQSVQRAFNDKGRFEYSCGIHPSMKGEIVVE